MPYALIAHRDGSYSVKNLRTGQFASKKTTGQKAAAQLRLLQALEKAKG